MEAYRLNSRLVQNEREYLIQTTNDVGLGSVSSDVFIDGALADSIKLPHPEHVRPEEVLAIVKATHSEKKKEIESLLKAYREVMESGDAEMLYHLAMTFFYKNFYAEARDLLRAAVSLKTDYHEAYNVLGQAELALSNTEGATTAAGEAVARRPEYADYRNNLGEALLAARSLKRAQEEFSKAIDINLYYGDAYFNYGLALVREASEQDKAHLVPNLVARAVDYFTKASLTNPDYKTAVFERGLEALKGQDVKQALKLLRKVRDEKKIGQGRRYAPYHMKYVLYPQWITEKAVQDRIKFLQVEIARNPGYVDLYIELSRCYLEQARINWNKGIDCYKKTLDMNPALERLMEYIDKAEEARDGIDEAIRRIAQKG